MQENPFVKSEVIGDTTYSTHFLSEEARYVLYPILEEQGLVEWYRDTPASYWHCEFRSDLSLLVATKGEAAGRAFVLEELMNGSEEAIRKNGLK